jgi:hypothetical protein
MKTFKEYTEEINEAKKPNVMKLVNSFKKEAKAKDFAMSFMKGKAKVIVQELLKDFDAEEVKTAVMMYAKKIEDKHNSSEYEDLMYQFVSTAAKEI